MKNVLVYLIFVLCGLSNAFSQSENQSTSPEMDKKDSVIYVRQLQEIVVTNINKSQYNRELARVRKIYPMALKAKGIIDEFEAEIATLDKKREIKKYSKKLNAYLKDEFSYSIKDLYTSEGRLLMQLIHRETGRTVDDIIVQYAGPTQAFIYRNMAKMFNQNLKATYEPEGSNYYTEAVIQDILEGRVEFDPGFEKMTKDAFKSSMEDYRNNKKIAKENARQREELQKEMERQRKEQQKKDKKEAKKAAKS